MDRAPFHQSESLLQLGLGHRRSLPPPPLCWRSPAWQSAQSTSACSLSPGVRAFVASETDGEDELIKIACRNAFWTLDRGFLGQLASFMGLEIGGSQASLFELLYGISKEVLGDRW